jgi:hypothetical protein
MVEAEEDCYNKDAEQENVPLGFGHCLYYIKMDSSSFEHALEADMKTLAAEIHRTQEMKDAKNAEGLDAVKEALRAFPQLDRSALEDNGVPAPTAVAQAFSNSPLPAYAQSAPPEIRLEIEYLLDIALHKGISAALQESAKSPYFVQDAFHDALAGRLYPELQKRGLMK